MFLSKKWILILISVTGITFMILLVIQYGWVRKAVDINRIHLAEKMRSVTNTIHEAFQEDASSLEARVISNKGSKEIFVPGTTEPTLENFIRHKLDSVLSTQQLPASAYVRGRIGSSCYLMNYVPDSLRSPSLDKSAYKLCLCNNHQAMAIDIGFDIVNADSFLVMNMPGLVLPSVILILLLIALFAYSIFIINRQKKQAELKNDFINNLTHEFNTPLFSIGLTSNMLLKSEAVHQSGKLKNYVELVVSEKDRIQLQVNKILALNAIESATEVIEKTKVDVHQLVLENLEAFRLIIAERKGSLDFHPGAAEHIVTGDRIHLYNAISNLLDNACKYSENIPQIIISSFNEGGRLCISIKDNGIGMRKTEITRIFEKFYRIKNGDRHDVKGFGLGLSYVRKIIELHKGNINVNSLPGTGSEFIISLPISK